MNQEPSLVRTRFAPSPTGYLHVGGLRTALFAWLLARQQDGQFILRLEDTDQAREVAGSDEHIQDSLTALGLDWDEGISKGGPHAPYKQSERLDSYKAWAQKLIAAGRAYADPYSSAEVQAFREQAQAAKQPFLYRNHRPEHPPVWDGSTALRFKSEPKAYTRTDAVMGNLSTGPEVIDDFILIKSDGFPTYNFAHIVDDYEMQITHVIRGQEFLASIPNYLNLYEALEITPPIMATMPHILGPDGRKKLSKRDGAKDVLDYIREGFLPETLLNFIASLGWNDGTEQEIFSTQELISTFSLERVQKSGARFDEARLLWMNGAHLRALPADQLYGLSINWSVAGGEPINFWPESAASFDNDYRKHVLSLVQERLKYLAEIPELTTFFFDDLPVNLELINSNKQLKKYTYDELRGWIATAYETLEVSDFTVSDLTERLNNLLVQTGQKPGVLFSLVRIATTWAPASPGLADTLAVLGRERSLLRLKNSVNHLQ